MRKGQHRQMQKDVQKKGACVYKVPVLGTVSGALNMQELQIIWNEEHNKREGRPGCGSVLTTVD